MSQASPLKKSKDQNDRYVPYVTGGGGGSTAILPSSAVYTVVNDEVDRAFDADTITLTDVSNVLATLIRDLQSTGIIK